MESTGAGPVNATNNVADVSPANASNSTAAAKGKSTLTSGLNSGISGVTRLGAASLGKGKSFCAEFKYFMNRGNSFDFALALLITGAFSAVVNAFVTDLITPLIGLASGQSLSEMFVVLRCGRGPDCHYSTRAVAATAGAVTWNWGDFLNSVIYFIIITLVLFICLKLFFLLRNKDLIKDKLCIGCTKPIPGPALRCFLCTTWQDVQLDTQTPKEVLPYFSSGSPSQRNHSTATLLNHNIHNGSTNAINNNPIHNDIGVNGGPMSSDHQVYDMGVEEDPHYLNEKKAL